MARKIDVKLIMELRNDGLSRRAIASLRHISRHSVSEVFDIANEKGINYEDVRPLSDADAYRLFYPDKHSNEIMFADPNYEHIHEELKKPGVTLKLLHEEYVDRCQQNGELPMGKTKFNEGYAEYTIANRLTNHLLHKPGECVEVDWSGPTMRYVDMTTGEIITIYLFVGTLPYSQFSYVEPCLNMKMDTFIRCHIHMYEFFGGVPIRTICDNLKAGVVSHPKEGEIILTDDYAAMGAHYQTAIMPTSVRKPKQKASVEGTVGKIATAIIAKCRNETFYSFAEVKKSVAEKLGQFNIQQFQKRDGSRYDVFQVEKEYLRRLPDIPYEISDWVYDRSVNLDFHVAYKKNRYSVPYQFSKKKVDLKVTDTTVEIYYKGERLATHNRFPDYMQNKYSTHTEDMPPAFRNIVQWDDVRIRNWAASIGSSTLQVINRIFGTVNIKEQAYNPCLAVLRLGKNYSDERLEMACELAIFRGISVPRYHHLKSILANNQDILYLEQKQVEPQDDDTSVGYLRGSDYYKEGGAK